MRQLRLNRRIVQGVEWMLILLALLLITSTEVYSSFATTGFVLLVAAFILRATRTGRLVPRTGLEIPGLLIVFSAGVSLWIAYDHSSALLQFIRILAAAVLFYAIADRPEGTTGYRLEFLVAAGFVVGATFLAIYWPAKHDFSLEPAKFSLLTFIGLWINNLIPVLPGPIIHSNVAAGTLALSTPFAFCLTLECWHLHKRFWALVFGVSFLIILGALALTSSRGAWVGLAGATGLAVLAWIQVRWFARYSQKVIYWSIVCLLILASAGFVIYSANLERLIGSIPGPSGTLINRIALWSASTTLTRDYFFTGVGLTGFNLVYSIYALKIYVPYLAHIHNFYLEVLIEQGILGIVGLISGGLVLASWVWRALDSTRPIVMADNPNSKPVKTPTILGWAGFFGLTAVAIHGMFDVVFYFERTLPLLGLATGFAFLAVPTPPHKHLSNSSRRAWTWSLAAILSGTFLVAALLFYRPLLGQLYANVGAARQSRTELSVYAQLNWQETPIEKMRQGINLDPSIQAYKRSLAWAPNNLTSLQRLSTIEHSLGQYEQALQHITTAWKDGNRDNVTRYLYGSALVANGQPLLAAQVLEGLPDAENYLLYQGYFVYYLSGDYLRSATAYQAALALNPESSSAKRGLADARYKLMNQPKP